MVVAPIPFLGQGGGKELASQLQGLLEVRDGLVQFALLIGDQPQIVVTIGVPTEAGSSGWLWLANARTRSAQSVVSGGNVSKLPSKSSICSAVGYFSESNASQRALRLISVSLNGLSSFALSALLASVFVAASACRTSASSFATIRPLVPSP